MAKKIFSFILLLTPLIALVKVSDVFYPYIAGKMLFWTILLLLASLALGAVLFEKKSRNSMLERMHVFFQEPLVLGVFAVLGTMLISACVAYEPHIAWWGSFVRWEGVMTFVLLSIYFAYLSIAFDSKAWKRFFILTAVVGGLSLLIAIVQALAAPSVAGGIFRPEALIGNPIFLAQYLVFAGTFAVLAVLSDDKKSRLKIGSAALILVLSGFGVILTQTRGVMVGIFAGALVALIVLFFQSSGMKARFLGKERNVRKWAGILVVLMVVLGGGFLATRHYGFWQHVPVIQRFASIGTVDKTTESRLITARTSIAAVNPHNEGWKRALFGWGNENYQFAWYKYYDPEIFAFERAPLDRAHDRFLDVLVMNGFVGLLAYLILIFFIFKSIMKLAGPEKYFLLFLIVAHLVQNLFAFESILSFIYLYTLIAYLVYRKNHA